MSIRDPHSKLAHLEACLSDEVLYRKSAGFECVELENQAGRSIALQEIDLSVPFLNQKLKAPLMIAPMTGGVQRGAELNRLWARAAQHFGIALGVGSQRVAIENPELESTFSIRSLAPDVCIFANIGAAQVAQGLPNESIQRAVDMLEANALFVHFNAMQEVCQKGDVDYRKLEPSMVRLCEYFQKRGVAVFAREVGFGLSEESARRLISMGVSGLDCAGAGGTSWSKVEALCSTSSEQRAMALRFGEWGIPTARSIQNVRAVSKTIPLIACGGIQNGQEALKAIHLGADIASMARPILLAAMAGERALFEFLEQVIDEMRIAEFASGVLNAKQSFCA
ncbi:MAG: type 2 isopentenyl-diphosphate Delta-isomerase [Myxococcaceae bacterium]|nr:type 2 isopentenyl-diphosphate Delta-isomerase [Myxococcaceae bacterium]MBH2005787.1 type 2 isopentenyl-diphosphate Delta-isomerase [Myxococcaceae bacterium]